ncbi:Prefoldin [Pterulicium gracile]|uniref:Prefoldin n=1 Tax=Pterulicium gracile TaxID=1884261 RepID=A0A5C3QDM8_9AGAR|nr:Prefoldin [Pterula gracilis]
MSSSKSKSQPSEQEIKQQFQQFQTELQGMASKIGELEQDSDEHSLVLTTLNEVLTEEPDRKCFRLIGGVLVERTVKDIVPTLQTNRDGMQKLIAQLAEQYRSKEKLFDSFKTEYNIRPAKA